MRSVYYALVGDNEVKDCSRYFWGHRWSKKFNLLCDATEYALEHLEERLPPYIPLPDVLPLHKIVTVRKLMGVDGDCKDRG